MPEYLSPGVYIEEVPSRLKAIEGVSTSTAAFVGRARRGTVPGYQWKGSATPHLPFPEPEGFVLTPDPSPVLVTSFAEFQREFGPPLPIPLANDPRDYGYLGWAVRAFFDNGGKRAYIARVVDPTDTASTMQAAQGLVYRLLRSAAKDDQTVFLTSTRGLKVNDTLTFKRHSDGQDVLGAPALPAVAPGTGPAPFGLKDGDSLTVTTTNPSSTKTATITAKPASVTIGPGPTYTGLDGTILKLRVGPVTEPEQSIPFSAADPFTPITAAGATADEVLKVLARFATGVRTHVDAGKVVIETDVRGSSARLQVLASGASDAAPLLGLTPGINLPPLGSSNVKDVDHVTVAELAALLTSANVAVSASASGALRIASTATGGTVTIELKEVSTSGTLLFRLGYPSGMTFMATGSTGSPPTVTVASYDAQANSVTLSGKLTAALDAGDVYAIATPPTAGLGPKFIARSPGRWSEHLSVQIASSDRPAVPILGTATIAPGATQLQVQNVSGLYVGAAIEIDYSGTGRSNHQIKEINSGSRQITIDPATTKAITPLASPTPPTVRALEIDVIVNDLTGAAPTEVYRGLSWNQTKGVADLRRHYAWDINARSRLVWVQPPVPTSETHEPSTQPTTPDGFPMKPKSADIGAESFNAKDETWIGEDKGPGQRSGIESLKDLSEARIIAAPGKSEQAIQLALIAQCELLRYRFAILDGERDPKAGSITSVLTHRNLYDTSFAAYYQPWMAVTVDGQTRYLPPSGYLAGIYARVDNARGVWKAPANEPVLKVLGLKTNYTTGEQDLLNPRGVNLIRQFDIGGIRVWGARTLSSDPDVKYINVRRTLIFIEASIDRGTQWVVFEPNSAETWVRLTDSVSAFLLTQWRSGALFGRSQEDAYFVRCDETTMTSDDILNGRLICEIGVAIVRPAEFVIFRIEQITNFDAAK